ncbi:MAG: hypothetical protein GDA52_07025 [Rhodobacteraceae bacterium]|nr:hypothetical protein [Paracoccaceae bacterium]
MQVRYEGALDRLRADLARRDADLAQRDTRQGEYIAQRDAELARRELRMTLTLLGAVLGSVGLATAILGFLIRLS